MVQVILLVGCQKWNGNKGIINRFYNIIITVGNFKLTVLITPLTCGIDSFLQTLISNTIVPQVN